MKSVSVKKITVDKINQLQKLGIQTFLEAFSSKNTEENMKVYLESSFSFEKLARELSDENSEFYFALIDNREIGYLKVNIGKAQSNIKGETALQIERIYVLEEFYGKKVGQLLYQKAITIAKRKDVNHIWLGVWEENPRAIRFYKKNGFKEFDKHIFKLGDDEQTDILMKLMMETATKKACSDNAS